MALHAQREPMSDLFAEYSRGEKLVDGCIHILAVAASLAAVPVLLILAIGHLSVGSTLSVATYAFALLALFMCSAAYHLTRSSQMKAVLRRFDHAAIYLKIAGTYTPIAVIKMADAAGVALLAMVWAITAVGATLKLLWPASLVRTSYVLYLVQGWAAVFVFNSLAASLSPRIFMLLLVGGVLYTVGVAFHLWRRLPYHTAIWHGLVAVAAGCHFAVILDAVIGPAAV
jgi:hemolysin III